MTGRRLEILILVGILAMYAGLVFYRLAEYPPFWYDDITVAQPPIDLLMQGNFPRAYTVPWYVHQFLMFGFLKVLGLGVVQIKLASVFMGSLLILATYLIAKKLFSVAVALIAILFLIVDPFFFQTARWGRSDITAAALFMLALYFFFQARERQSSLMFSLSAIALGASVFSHENGLFLGVPIMFMLLVLSFGWSFLKRKQFWVFSLTLVLVAVPYILYVAQDFPNFRSQVLFVTSTAGQDMGGFVFYHQSLASLFTGEVTQRWRLYIENYSLILGLYLLALIGGLMKREKSTGLLATIVIAMQVLFFFIKKNNFYLVWMAPFLCVLLASLFVDSLNYFAEGRKGHFREILRSNRFATLVMAFLVFVVCFGAVSRIGVATLHSDSYDSISSQLKVYIPAQARVLGPAPFWLALLDRDFRGYGTALTYANEKSKSIPDFSVEQATLEVLKDFKPDYIIYEENDLPSNLPVRLALKKFLASSQSTREAVIAGGWHYGEVEVWKISPKAAN